MEKIFSEYSKFLDKSGSHLSLQTLAMYINLQNLLSTKRRHLYLITYRNAGGAVIHLILSLMKTSNWIQKKMESPYTDSRTTVMRILHFLQVRTAWWRLN
ncbi:MAG TPA: hypothetical protein VKD08_05605 [Ignavibacteriaceae bacterium]|nr:hypothetical protein [Ignavibacteriaceae bacterium]